MVDRLPAWIFLSIALLLIALALLPLMRVVVGVDQEIGMQFFSVVMFLIGGLMSGLTAMILLVRRQPKLNWPENVKAQTSDSSLLLHSTGLLMFTGIPLLNFLTCYWFWVNRRQTSEAIDRIGQEVLNYQITMYLYLLLSLFIIFAGIGLITTPLLLSLHLIFTLIAMAMAAQGKHFNYPLNIPIIQGRPEKVPLG